MSPPAHSYSAMISPTVPTTASPHWNHHGELLLRLQEVEQTREVQRRRCEIRHNIRHRHETRERSHKLACPDGHKALVLSQEARAETAHYHLFQCRDFYRSGWHALPAHIKLAPWRRRRGTGVGRGQLQGASQRGRVLPPRQDGESHLGGSQPHHGICSKELTLSFHPPFRIHRWKVRQLFLAFQGLEFRDRVRDLGFSFLGFGVPLLPYLFLPPAIIWHWTTRVCIAWWHCP